MGTASVVSADAQWRRHVQWGEGTSSLRPVWCRSVQRGVLSSSVVWFRPACWGQTREQFQEQGNKATSVTDTRPASWTQGQHQGSDGNLTLAQNHGTDYRLIQDQRQGTYVKCHGPDFNSGVGSDPRYNMEKQCMQPSQWRVSPTWCNHTVQSSTNTMELYGLYVYLCMRV